MQEKTVEFAQKVARQFLVHPTATQGRVAQLCDTSGARISLLIKAAGGIKTLLLTFGPQELATAERIEEVLAYRDPRSMYARDMTAVVPKKTCVPPAPTAPMTKCFRSFEPLKADECQWVVNSEEPPYFCGKEVEGLYCHDHDILARAAEKERFLNAGRTR